MSKKIYVLGSLNMDLVISTPRMPLAGETITGGGFMTNSGGKGANQAVAAARLGSRVYMVGCVGRDAFGGELKSTLAGYGVDTRFVASVEGSSGIAVILVENGENRIILDGGANLLAGEKEVDAALESAEAGDILVSQFEIPQETVEYAFVRAKEKGMLTILNPAPAAEFSARLKAATDILIVNETECAILSGIVPDGESAMLSAAEKFRERGIDKLIITLGKAGSAYIRGGKIAKIPARRVKAVDTTAAGDAYIGALASVLAKGGEVLAGMEYASAVSALTVTKKGAQQSMPAEQEVREFLEGC